MLDGRISRIVGLIVGVVLIGATVFAVVTYKRNVTPPELPQVVRPVKTLIVGGPMSTTIRKYPGRIRALQRADVAFEVSGIILERYVDKGSVVKKGDPIARLDARDYENDLTKAKADLHKYEVYLDRVKTAVEKGAATVQELTDAEADVEVAQAQARIKQKAVDDTTIYASFDGVIANIFAEQFENVAAKQPIVSLQDNTKVLVDASVPEWRFAEGPNRGGDLTFKATFDYLPGVEFPVTVYEYTTEADPVTQTYEVTFEMSVPEGVNILPGMTATVHELLAAQAEGSGFGLPLAIVPVDSGGQYYVWRLSPTGTAGEYVVNRVDVQTGEMTGIDVIITGGLAEGDRIASAGVHSLHDGQIVTLWDAKKGVVLE